MDKKLLEKIINNELGNLKIEWDKCGKLKFYGLKDYENFTTQIRKTKGIRKNSEKFTDEYGNIIDNKYLMQIFKILNREKEIGIVIEKRIKELKYITTKLRYNTTTGQGTIFKDKSDYYNYNKVKIPFTDKCTSWKN